MSGRLLTGRLKNECYFAGNILARIIDCFQTGCDAPGYNSNDESTDVLLSFPAIRAGKFKPPALRVVFDSPRGCYQTITGGLNRIVVLI